MTAMEQALSGMWQGREKQKLPYLLVNDVRGFFPKHLTSFWSMTNLS